MQRSLLIGINYVCSMIWLSAVLFQSPVVKAEAIPLRYQQIAYHYQIPASILYAVALTESGKKIKTGLFRPWPWTLNVAGQAKRYKTRREAWQAIEHYLSQGIRSIDIGLLQINWRWNKAELRNNTWQALDPLFNAQTGARLLRNAYRAKGNWPHAIGHYHSPGQKPRQKHRARKYTQRVLKHYQQIIEAKT